MKIVSAGLTNNPHLPVHFFNADDTLAEPAEAGPANVKTNNTTNTMKKKLIALFAALSLKPTFANAAEPTDTEMESAIGEIETKVATFANDKTAWETATTGIKKKLVGLAASVGITFANEAEITDPAATIAQIEEKIKGNATALTDANTRFANERADRIKDELALGISSGRITAAEQADWERRLKTEAQFANERTALRALAAKVKTTSITLQRGGKTEQVDISDPKARATFANEVMGAIAVELKLNRTKDHTRIYAEAQRRHPALFEGMQSVDIKMPGKKK